MYFPWHLAAKMECIYLLRWVQLAFYIESSFWEPEQQKCQGNKEKLRIKQSEATKISVLVKQNNFQVAKSEKTNQ